MVSAQLKTFLCVADNGSFSKAADKLYLSTTAIIKQMNTLEKQLDLKLLNRTNHGVTLTPAGNVIYKHAKFMVDYAEKAVEEARALERAEKQVFRVGTSLLNPCKPFMDLWYPSAETFQAASCRLSRLTTTTTALWTPCSRSGKSLISLSGLTTPPCGMKKSALCL